jgi:Fe-S-cluster-containing dehydrogenase component
MAHYGMVMDQRRCVGCQSCTVACRTWNDLPLDIIYNPVVSEGVQGVYPNVHETWTPLICMHCVNAPCVACCPTGASQKDPETGIVFVENTKCMGCKVCVNACPYGARDTSEMVGRFEGYVRKCTFCKDRVAEGEQPYCVVTCHQKARIFGDLDDPESDISKLIGSVGTYRLLEEYGTEPSVYYISDLGGKR